jgi:hypothetical protein
MSHPWIKSVARLKSIQAILEGYNLIDQVLSLLLEITSSSATNLRATEDLHDR